MARTGRIYSDTGTRLWYNKLSGLRASVVAFIGFKYFFSDVELFSACRARVLWSEFALLYYSHGSFHA